MPRTISAPFQTHLNGGTYTVAACWKIVRTDGMTLGFTSHDQDLTIGGQLYKAAESGSASALRSTVGTGVDNMDCEAIFDSAYITEADMLSGLYDNAAVTIFWVNYADLTQGVITILSGLLGEVTVENGSFKAELQSNIQRAQQQVCSVTSSLCRALEFGDGTCQYAGTIVYTPFTVTSVASNRQFASTGVTQADDFFTSGQVIWLTGANANLSMEVKRSLNAGGSIELQLPMANTVAIGDTFTLKRGCNRTFVQCQVYANAKNFQAEPTVPGRDVMFSVPK